MSPSVQWQEITFLHVVIDTGAELCHDNTVQFFNINQEIENYSQKLFFR